MKLWKVASFLFACGVNGQRKMSISKLVIVESHIVWRKRPGDRWRGEKCQIPYAAKCVMYKYILWLLVVLFSRLVGKNAAHEDIRKVQMCGREECILFVFSFGR